MLNAQKFKHEYFLGKTHLLLLWNSCTYLVACLRSGWMNRQIFAFLRHGYCESPTFHYGTMRVFITEMWYVYISPSVMLIQKYVKPIRWSIIWVTLPFWHFCTCAYTLPFTKPSRETQRLFPASPRCSYWDSCLVTIMLKYKYTKKV